MSVCNPGASDKPPTAPSPVLGARPLGFPWQTDDPFLFCVYHDDAYPAGNERLGPAASLAGRQLGMDFEVHDGWRMYHGHEVPGFPQHPHRGFETVTILRRGYVDHSDSLGATARFGPGDTQWLTAGRGIVHSEMFPLLARDAPNPLELFQIWLNLPRASKFAEPHFSMLWAERIPRLRGPGYEVVGIAGALHGASPPPPAPPPESWASRPDAHVAIATLTLEAGAAFTLPAGAPGLNRTVYFFRGDALSFDQAVCDRPAAIRLRSDVAVTLTAGATAVEVLVLQGRPVGEPVVQHGPFVMSSQDEIIRAFEDYRRTQFGGWPWPVDGPVHARDAGRFAAFGGRVERPEG